MLLLKLWVYIWCGIRRRSEERFRYLATLTKELLVEMIEEVLDEVALCRNPQTGHFDDCKTGAIYSLSHRAARENGLDPKLVGRGKLTKKRKVQAPFGMNTSQTKQCGRQTIQGDKKKKDKRCRDYPKGHYSEYDHPLLPSDDDTPKKKREKILPGSSALASLAKGIVSEDEDDVFISLNDLMSILSQARGNEDDKGDDLLENNADLMSKCRSIGFVTRQEAFKGLVVSLNQLKKAQDGKLYEPQKG